MKQNGLKAELLAPAGNIESLKAAAINGANAVYLGLDAFNARSSAENFSILTLKEAVEYAHIFSLKVYLTLNTLLKDSEVVKAVSLAKQAWDSGVSAVIVQDLGLARALKNKHPEIVLHASTQMGVHNLFGALAAQSLGIERVILSRETPLTEIENISKNCSLELEYFVHGALCCGFSGNCYFSGVVCGKSGNRGQCLQLCRKPYIMQNKGKAEQGHWLSTRDTMLAANLERLSNAGVCSFKIEGRMKRPEYVGEVTRIYAKALQAIVDANDVKNLKLMFNRGNFATAHIFGADSGIIYPKLPSHMGVRLGSVKSVFGNNALLDCRVDKGDGLKFLRDLSEVGHALVLHSGNSTGFVGKVQLGDDVYLTDSAKMNQQINARIRKLPLKIDASFSLKQNSCTVRLSSNEVFGRFVYPLDLQAPQKSPVSTKDINECLTSLGGTHFECVEFKFKSDSAFFATKAALKGLRRQFVDDFQQHLLSSFKRPCAANENLQDIFAQLQPLDVAGKCTIIMCDQEDAKTYASFADFVAIKPDSYVQLLADINSGVFKIDKSKYMLDLPVVSFGPDLELLQKIINTNAFDKFIVNNIYGLSLVKGKILLGYKMNMLNNFIDFPKVGSIEGLLDVKPAKNEFTYVFGCPDLMQTVHCYYKQKCGCNKCADLNPITLTDNKGETYQIKRQKLGNCYNLMVLGTPINLSGNGAGKSFIDAKNLNKNQRKSLLDFLTGATNQIITDKSFKKKKLH